MTESSRRELSSYEQEQITREIEALRTQINQIQEQVNYLSQLSGQLSERSLNGLLALGTVSYFLFLPLRWLKRFLFIPIRLIRRLKDPHFYWTGVYWFWFIRVVIESVGLKKAVISFLHPRRFLR